MSERFRRRPHALPCENEFGQPDEVYGEPPAHTMLAAYNGNMLMSAFVKQPDGGLCVIATQKNNRGQVIVSVWQRGERFRFTEGMVFDLLDQMDGNVPAVMICGVLRIDELGNYPYAPDNIRQLWGEAETCFFQDYGCYGAESPSILRDECLITGAGCLKQRWQWQWAQQQNYQQWTFQQQVQQTQNLLCTTQTSATPLQSQQSPPSSQQRKFGKPKRRRTTDGAVQKGAGIRKSRKARKNDSPREKTPPTPDTI